VLGLRTYQLGALLQAMIHLRRLYTASLGCLDPQMGAQLKQTKRTV